jgi:hypothetical protein
MSTASSTLLAVPPRQATAPEARRISSRESRRGPKARSAGAERDRQRRRRYARVLSVVQRAAGFGEDHTPASVQYDVFSTLNKPHVASYLANTYLIALRSNSEPGTCRGALDWSSGGIERNFHESGTPGQAKDGKHLDAVEHYLRLALKAQSQCRATLETLAISSRTHQRYSLARRTLRTGRSRSTTACLSRGQAKQTIGGVW